MGWSREVVATPEGLADALAGLEAPERAGEAMQFERAVAAAIDLAGGVSKREPMLVSLSGHTDPNGEGFDPRNVSVNLSRIEPEAAKKRSEEAAAQEAEAEEAKAAAEEQAQRAHEAKEKADAEVAAAEPED